MTSAIEKRIQQFFDQYATASRSGDAKIVGAAYFKTYLELAPLSVEAFIVDAA